MYEMPVAVTNLIIGTSLTSTTRREIARRAVAAEIQKQIDELAALKDSVDWVGDGPGMTLARSGLQAAIDHLRIRLAEVTVA